MKKIKLSAIAALFAVAAVGVSYANSRALVSVHFKAGQPLSQAKVAAAYEPNTGGFSCTGAANLPCIIQYDNSVYPTLQDYLDSFSTPTDVKNAAVSVRAI